MPKVSKVQSRAPNRKPAEDDPEKFRCCRCGKNYDKQKMNFPVSQSAIYRGNGGYLPVCRNCLNELYNHYCQVLGDEKAALRRVCQKFDIFWSEKACDTVYRYNNTTTPMMQQYIARANLVSYVGKTYDDTLDSDEESDEAIARKRAEEIVSAAKKDADAIREGALQASAKKNSNDTERMSADEDDITVTQDIIDFWGTGLTVSMYRELEKRFRYWVRGYDSVDDIKIGEKALLRQICILEININHDSAAGKPVSQSITTLNSLIGSANMKPVQAAQEEAAKAKGKNSASLDDITFGTGIKIYESIKPVPDPDPEFEDVDGIRKYISVWFWGHLCKMLKINNSYSKMY